MASKVRRRRAGRKRKAMAPRQPNGQIRKSEYADSVGMTPELAARRKELLGSKNAPGETDCVLDHLAADRIVTEKQAEAGRRYAISRDRALRASGLSPNPASPRLSEWIDRGSVQSPLAPDDGRASYHWRKARECVFDCGADVRRIVEKVCIDNAPIRLHERTRLRLGLDALVRMWRL